MRLLLTNIGLRELRLLLLGVGAIVTCAAIFGSLVPNAKALQTANREVLSLERAGQDGNKLELELEKMHVGIQELQYRLDGDLANLPAKQVEAYIIGRLQRVSWGNSVDLVSVEPANGDRMQNFQEVLFNVQLVGQYEDLYKWLIQAREELGYIVVKEYTVRRQDSEDQQPRLAANLSLASYRSVE